MQHNTKLSFLEKIFGKYRYHANTHEAEFFSPFCSHYKPKLTINLVSDFWQCWISGEKGKKLLYPMKKAGATREQLQYYIDNFKPKGIIRLSNRYEGEFINLAFPESYIALVNCKNSLIGKKAWNYLLKRGVSELDILRYKIGVCIRGEFEDRIIFPSFDKKGNLNFYTGRSSSGHYRNASVPKGYRNSIILNEINIDWNLPVVLTEGFIDLFKSVPNTIPLFGSTLHSESLLFETIINKCSEIVLAFDQDAWDKQDKVAKLLNSYDVFVSQMQLTEDDLGDQTKKEGLSLYENRVSWTPKNAFLRRLKAL